MLDEVDGVGRDRHRADGLLVTGVTDVEDRVALVGPHLELVVDLGHERAAGVDHDAPSRRRRLFDLRGRSVGREHDGRRGRDLVDVVDEHDALAPELLDDQAVVDDLVVAVDGRLEDADHPCERLDGHLDAGTEASRLREQDEVDAAGLRLARLLSSRCHGRPG